MTILSEKHDAPLLGPSTHPLHSPWLLQELLKHLSISSFKLLTHHLFPHSTTWVLKLLSGHDAPLGKPSVASHCRLKSIFSGLQYSFYKSRKKEFLLLFSNTKETAPFQDARVPPTSLCFCSCWSCSVKCFICHLSISSPSSSSFKDQLQCHWLLIIFLD